MKRLLLIPLTILLTLLSCSQKGDVPAEQTEAERIADSLQAAADSIAYVRKLHSMQTGAHFHKSKDLAAIAHQDPKKKVRFKRRQYEGKAAKKASARKRHEQVQKMINEQKQKQDISK